MNLIERVKTGLLRRPRLAASLLLPGALALLVLLVLLSLMTLLAVVLAGLAVGSGVLLWALLKGRRPASLRFGQARPRSHGPGAAVARRRSSHPDVVDVQARDVSPSGSADDKR